VRAVQLSLGVGAIRTGAGSPAEWSGHGVEFHGLAGQQLSVSGIHFKLRPRQTGAAPAARLRALLSRIQPPSDVPGEAARRVARSAHVGAAWKEFSSETPRLALVTQVEAECGRALNVSGLEAQMWLSP